VINGQVATAGLTQNLSSKRGINVPIILARSITHTSASETVRRISKENQNITKDPAKSMSASDTPLKKLSKISLMKRCPSQPVSVPLASHCTTIALDWTQTFHAIAAISGVKKNNSG